MTSPGAVPPGPLPGHPQGPPAEAAPPEGTSQPLLPYAGIEWGRVSRARFYVEESFAYHYPAPISRLEHRLMIAPPRRLGDQRRLRRSLELRPRSLRWQEQQDRFGNLALMLETPRVRRTAVFAQTLLTERFAGGPPLRLSAEQARVHAHATALTTPDAQLAEVAQILRRQARSPQDLAERVSAHVAGHMRYASGVTGVRTSAAEAYALGAGLCQDYAHIALTLCRAAGLPARYVSGHMPGEGSSHAWLEALVPEGSGFRALGLDPTNQRPPHLGYVVVTFGNDYRDVAPTSGLYLGPGPGVLEYRKHAGLVELEFADGERRRAS